LGVTGPAGPIIVIGAGAIGSFLAARLHLAGEPVALLARGERITGIRRDGLRLAVVGLPERVDVPLCVAPDPVAPARLILFCIKSGDLSGALTLAAPGVSPQTALMLVQNGVEAPDMAAARFPANPVIASRVHGFFELEGGLVRHVGVAPSLELGVIGGRDKSASEIAGLLNRSGILARCATDIEASLWSKFLLAASLGGVGLACRLPAGQVLHDPAAGAMLAAAMNEVRDLALAKGVTLAPDIVATTLAFVANFPADATTSLQRDIMLGRASEYAFLPGAVLRLGRELGVSTPCFDQIDRLASAANDAVEVH
jgi:2-dehydropantoate 2-reductase